MYAHGLVPLRVDLIWRELTQVLAVVPEGRDGGEWGAGWGLVGSEAIHLYLMKRRLDAAV